jgi:branched-chain amino acid transport system substrate-binding protein
MYRPLSGQTASFRLTWRLVLRVDLARRGARQVFGVLTVFVAVSALAACGGSSLDAGGAGEAADGTGAIDIGLLVPKSGVYAPLGDDMEQGFRLCLDQAGGQLAGHQVNVTVVDEGEGPDVGVPAAQGLVQDGVTAVVGVVSSATALGVRDLFTEAQIPLLVANAGANDITGAAASDYVWRTAYNSEGLSGAIGPYVAEQVGDGGVYVMAADYAAGHEHAAAFKKTFEAAGGRIAGEAYTPFGKTENFQPFLAQVRQSGAQALYVFYAGSEAVNFTKQFKAFGLDDQVKLYAAGFLTEGGVLDALGQDALGVETSLQYSPQLDTPRNQEFVEAYTAAYNEPPTVYSVQAYDASQSLDKGLESGRSGEEVVAGLKAIDTIDSPAGQFSFTEGHQADYTYYLRSVELNGDKVVNNVVRPLDQ